MTAPIIPLPVGAKAQLALIAPAGPASQQELEAGIACFEAMGFSIQQGQHIDARAPERYLAGADEARLEDLLWALEGSAEAVLVTRGGYGLMRLLPKLLALEAQLMLVPKRVAGYSDITALHLWLNERLGWASIHGCMMRDVGRRAAQADALALAQALRCKAPGLVHEGLELWVGGRAQGRLIGGNLSLVHSLYRSPVLPSLAGRVLFLEEVAEAPYAIDRMLHGLELRGAVDELAGLVLGHFTGCGETPYPASTLAILRRWGRPTLIGLEAGHEAPNLPLWLGVEAEVNAGVGALSVG